MTPEQKIAKMPRPELEKLASGLVALAVKDDNFEKVLRHLRANLKILTLEQWHDNVRIAIDFVLDCNDEMVKGKIEEN